MPSFPAEPGRLDVVVAARLGVPRAEVQRAIAEGLVMVDGRPRPKSFRLTGGERIETRLRDPGELEPDPATVPIRYEDRHLMVVAKPAGVATHPTASKRTGTLVNRLLGLGLPLSRIGGEDRPGIVHRLDAGTSGLMVVAKDDSTHRALSELFRRHRVGRTYLALVRGDVTQPSLRVDAPLGRQGARIRVRAATGREAVTEAEVRERMGRATLLEVRPRTGRTHQIRVHLSAIGHPVLGDRAYGGGGPDAALLGLARPFLHSWRVSFEHPVTGEPVECEEPLPADLDRALRRARDDRPAPGEGVHGSVDGSPGRSPTTSSGEVSAETGTAP
jgi:23S rRNA pseudouridine1911/1915/1917 synthase